MYKSKENLNKLTIVLGICSIFALCFLLFFNFLKSSKKNKETGLFKIGIIQIVEHDCLNETRRGFVDGLKRLGVEEGKNVTFDYQNAQGEQSVCDSIAKKMVAENKDLIFAISTPASQTALNATKKIPIVISAVSDPYGANLRPLGNSSDTNVTGVSDSSPIDSMIDLIINLVPNLKRIAILYASNESNSKSQADDASSYCLTKNIETQHMTVSNSTEIRQTIESLKNIDALFVPTDNTIFASMPLVTNTADLKNIPVFASGVESVANGATAARGVDYFGLGVQCASQTYDILFNKKAPRDIPIESCKKVVLMLNDEKIEKFKIKIPDSIREELKEK